MTDGAQPPVVAVSPIVAAAVGVRSNTTVAITGKTFECVRHHAHLMPAERRRDHDRQQPGGDQSSGAGASDNAEPRATAIITRPT